MCRLSVNIKSAIIDYVSTIGKEFVFLLLSISICSIFTLYAKWTYCSVCSTDDWINSLEKRLNDLPFDYYRIIHIENEMIVKLMTCFSLSSLTWNQKFTKHDQTNCCRYFEPHHFPLQSTALKTIFAYFMNCVNANIWRKFNYFLCSTLNRFDKVKIF